MPDRMIDAMAPRIIPPLDDVNRPFWTGGATGELRIQRCDACSHFAHPPTTECPECGGTLHHETVSGKGTVFTFTVNHQAFHPEVPVPYVIALVALDDAPGVRIVTNIVNCAVDAVRVGMPVCVLFEQHGDAYMPVFEPAP